MGQGIQILLTQQGTNGLANWNSLAWRNL